MRLKFILMPTTFSNQTCFAAIFVLVKIYKYIYIIIPSLVKSIAFPSCSTCYTVLSYSACCVLPLHHMFLFSLLVFSLLKFSPLISSLVFYITIQGRGLAWPAGWAGECCYIFLNIIQIQYVVNRAIITIYQ